MILIASAAYIDQDLSSEVGLIPPSFLPIGNKRLYEYQTSLFSNNAKDVYLSLPESYHLSECDRVRIEELGANILFVPDNISLGESILYCWNATGKNYNHLNVLLGDTLFLKADINGEDYVSISVNQGAYNRASVDFDNHNKLLALKQSWVNDQRYVLSGFFSFASPQFLMKSIIESKNNFIKSLENYSLRYPINCMALAQWLDFGHLNSFFASRTAMTTQRIFNDLKITKRSVIKTSKDLVKMQAESDWFQKMPASLRIYMPALLKPCTVKAKKASYSIEYLYLLPLSDLFVFGNHSVDTWKQIFLSAKEILDDFMMSKNELVAEVDATEFNQMYLTKTLSRLDIYKNQTGFPIDELQIIAKESSSFIEYTPDDFNSIIHGDFCFSNLLYDSRTKSLKLIDPRGMDSNRRLTLLGDQRYDLAKLFHSAVGCYDLIIAGRYLISDNEIKFYDNAKLKLIEDAFDQVFCKEGLRISKKELLAINVHLFLSMLPLHSDCPNRQVAMIMNAKRLFNMLRLMD